jgi:hypothetical protein
LGTILEMSGGVRAGRPNVDKKPTFGLDEKPSGVEPLALLVDDGVP